MNSITCDISISLDGFVAGPNQSLENPIGEGGMRLHQWAFKTASWRQQQGLEGGERSADSEVVDEVVQDVGAYIMGRKMFGGGEGAWDHAWTVILGGGERLLDNVGDPNLQPIGVIDSPAVTHVKYRVIH